MSDLAKVDAHVIGPDEYEELPEITDEDMARAVFSKGAETFPNPVRVAKFTIERHGHGSSNH